MEYIIYVDESGKEGTYYSNFYGGVLVRSDHRDYIEKLLNEKKESLGFKGEVKWQRVSLQYLDKYIELMDTFFDLIEQDLLKVRIMFTHNYREAKGLTVEQRKETFTLLYYQFMKHAFGLPYSNDNNYEEIYLRIYFDELPVNAKDADKFKDYVYRIQTIDEFKKAKIKIRSEDITEIDSKKHVLLQYKDIVLGSMYFKLNNLHKEIPEGKSRRGKRTIAKEKLYKHINKRIRRIYPNFNIGISTGVKGDKRNRWNHPYRHWLFTPTEYKINEKYSKDK